MCLKGKRHNGVSDKVGDGNMIHKNYITIILFAACWILLFPIAAQAETKQMPQMGDMILVNTQNPLPETYIPDDLVEIKDYISLTKKSITLREVAAKALEQMTDAMAKDGITDIKATSGYRSYQYQLSLYQNKIRDYEKIGYDLAKAKELAASIVALPGTSEHQTGLAIDFTTDSLSNQLVSSFGDTEAGKWLNNNSWYYGYIIRYQTDKRDITGYINEPWHLRYIGIPHAEYIFRNNLCYEEYIRLLKTDGQYTYRSDDGTTYFVRYISSKEKLDIVNTSDYSSCSSDNTGGYILTKTLDIPADYTPGKNNGTNTWPLSAPFSRIPRINMIFFLGSLSLPSTDKGPWAWQAIEANIWSKYDSHNPNLNEASLLLMITSHS